MSRISNLKRIYAELPTIQCKGECWAFCSPIRRVTSDLEWDRMTAAAGGRVPEQSHPDLCAFLRDGRCSVYRERPFVCWAYGVVESMVCPYGCKPKPRYLTTAEMHVFLFRIRSGCTQEEAERFIGTAPIGWNEWGTFSGSADLTLRSWTLTERRALLKLYREGRTEHIPLPALRALELIKDDPD